MAEGEREPEIAQDGYWHAHTATGSVQWINGRLHYAIRPIADGNRIMWVPVREYIGPVQHVDSNGRALARSPDDGGTDAER